MFVSESISDMLKPKSKKEVSDTIKSMSVEEKQFILYDKGLEYFLGDFESFFEWLEEKYPKDNERLWFTLTSTIELIFPVKNIDKQWILETFDISDILEDYIDSMKEKNIDDALSCFIPGYVVENKSEKIVINQKKLVNLLIESLEDYLEPKTKDEMIEDTKKLDFQTKHDLVDDLWRGDFRNFARDIRNYIGGFKFDEMMAELIVLKQRGEM